MAELRALLEDELGFAGVRTLGQSGNVAFAASRTAEAKLVERLEAAVDARFGVPARVMVRTRAQLAAVVAGDPFGAAELDPASYLVGFCDVPPGLLGLDAGALAPERVAVDERTLYLWLPDGTQRSPLMKALSRLDGGVAMTTRNWRTVTGLLELAGR